MPTARDDTLATKALVFALVLGAATSSEPFVAFIAAVACMTTDCAVLPTSILSSIAESTVFLVSHVIRGKSFSGRVDSAGAALDAAAAGRLYQSCMSHGLTQAIAESLPQGVGRGDSLQSGLLPLVLWRVSQGIRARPISLSVADILTTDSFRRHPPMQPAAHRVAAPSSRRQVCQGTPKQQSTSSPAAQAHSHPLLSSGISARPLSICGIATSTPTLGPQAWA